jgi:hypothetical protein
MLCLVLSAGAARSLASLYDPQFEGRSVARATYAGGRNGWLRYVETTFRFPGNNVPLASGDRLESSAFHMSVTARFSLN